jgi:hypothetical protein
MLTAKAIRRGVFPSVPDLIAAIDGYLAATNTNPKPFTWDQDHRPDPRESPTRPRDTRPNHQLKR